MTLQPVLAFALSAGALGGCADAADPVVGVAAQRLEPGSWKPRAPMVEPHGYHRASPLADGRVIVSGGVDPAILASAEVYAPLDDAWTPVADMIDPRIQHVMTTLPD